MNKTIAAREEKKEKILDSSSSSIFCMLVVAQHTPLPPRQLLLGITPETQYSWKGCLFEKLKIRFDYFFRFSVSFVNLKFLSWIFTSLSMNDFDFSLTTHSFLWKNFGKVIVQSILNLLSIGINVLK